MDEKQKEVSEVAPSTREGQETPFILQFLEAREGATAGTTSGTWPDVDSADAD